MRTALITGATSGIGRAIAEKFAEHGFRLVICGRRQEKLDELAGQLLSKTDIFTLNFDVRNQNEVQTAIDSLPENFRNIDILVNNAGNAHGLDPISEGSISDWDAMLDGNVKGLLYVSKAIIPRMKDRRSGHIVNMSSVAARQTYISGVVYCASKKAVDVISEGMRLELTEFGIKVTNIQPGAVETEFSLVRFKGDEERASKVYQGFEPILPENIADIVLYCVNAPKNITIADMAIFADAQSAPTTIFRKN